MSYKNILIIILIIYNFYLALSLTECGISKGSYYIVGGEPTKPLQWPWMASITVNLMKMKFLPIYDSCGGSIISDRYILTAAHCFDTDLDETYIDTLVVLGKHNMSKTETTEVKRYAAKIIKHEDYDEETDLNDIALIQISPPLNFTGEHKHLQTICLPKYNESIIKQNCIATGWGFTKANGTVSDVLRQVRLPILNNTYCDKVMEIEDKMKNSVFCAGYDEGLKDACQGDSGGPLVCPTLTGSWIQEGIVSFGDECAMKGKPGVYTKVSHYYDWIQKNMI